VSPVSTYALSFSRSISMSRLILELSSKMMPCVSRPSFLAVSIALRIAVLRLFAAAAVTGVLTFCLVRTLEYIVFSFFLC
jgi:hypothetical protein